MDGLMLLRRAHEARLAVAAEGDKLVIRGPKRAEPVAQLLIENKAAVLAALVPLPEGRDAAWWRHEYRVCTLDRVLGNRPYPEAAWLAWGELQCRWHRLYGERMPEWQCACCGEPIGGFAALDLADGNRVHLQNLDCLLSFGARWRNDATAGLRALGLDPPPGFELL